MEYSNCKINSIAWAKGAIGTLDGYKCGSLNDKPVLCPLLVALI
jgi:hypothetical protein